MLNEKQLQSPTRKTFPTLPPSLSDCPPLPPQHTTSAYNVPPTYPSRGGRVPEETHPDNFSTCKLTIY